MMKKYKKKLNFLKIINSAIINVATHNCNRVKLETCTYKFYFTIILTKVCYFQGTHLETKFSASDYLQIFLASFHLRGMYLALLMICMHAHKCRLLPSISLATVKRT